LFPIQVFFLAVCLFAVSQAAEEWTAERIEKALAGVPLKNYYDFLPEELKQQIDPTMEKRSARYLNVGQLTYPIRVS